MNLASILALSILAVPSVDKHDATVIQKALNNSVEVQQPDAQEIENRKILAGGKTAEGDYLYVCEGDLVWSLDRQEYLKRFETYAKSVPFGELGAAIGMRYTPQFKKGDLVTKVRMRVRFEEAGGDLIAMSAKTIRFDLGFTKPVSSENTLTTTSDK